MPCPTSALPAEPAAPALLLANLAAVEAALLTQILLQPHPQLLIDCEAQPCWHGLGVCHFISQLLLLRHRGGSVWLRNADPLLRRCLQQLGLTAYFFVAE